MKVKEMIELLKKCDPDAAVCVQSEFEEMVQEVIAVAKYTNGDILFLNAEEYGWSSLEIVE